MPDWTASETIGERLHGVSIWRFQTNIIRDYIRLEIDLVVCDFGARFFDFLIVSETGTI